MNQRYVSQDFAITVENESELVKGLKFISK